MNKVNENVTYKLRLQPERQTFRQRGKSDRLIDGTLLGRAGGREREEVTKGETDR